MSKIGKGQVSLLVHRGTRQIGGNCVELRADGHRLLIDAGLPLEKDASLRDPAPMTPKTLSWSERCDGLIISHPHIDHFGLVSLADANCPLWCGTDTEKLIMLTIESQRAAPLQSRFSTFKNALAFSPCAGSPFKITPYLVDHSAFDSYMLMIEACGRKILYSGDFRMSGAKAPSTRKLIEETLKDSAPDILLLEGTTIGNGGHSCRTEASLQTDFQKAFESTPGITFAACSSQNIDRIVSIYKAARKAKRELIVDLHTALILSEVSDDGRRAIPNPKRFEHVKVLITSMLGRRLKRNGENAFVDELVKARKAISALILAMVRRRSVFSILSIRSISQALIRPRAILASTHASWLK